MKNPPIVGMCGYARVGKDTLGAILTEAHGYERRAFADKLRELAWLADPGMGQVVAEVGYEEAKKDEWLGVRQYLVDLGAGARKVLGGDVWLNATLPRNTNMKWGERDDAWKPAVVTDVRYRNEAQRIADLGGEVWYISRPGYEAANEEEQRSIAEILQHGPRMRWFVNDHALVDLPYVVSRFLAHDAD